MSPTITIDPVTRIEGHGKVFLDFTPDGELESAGLIVNELRGFERILVGIEADRMPLITARICGVCPSAHHLAASKALDAAAGVQPPPAAALLRELLFMGHYVHSHALSLFVLQGPDLVMGLDASPTVRNIVGVVEAAPEVAKKALRCRTLGQKINEMVGGRGVHPVTSVAGGITFRLDNERRHLLTTWFEEAARLTQELAGVARTLVLQAYARAIELVYAAERGLGVLRDQRIGGDTRTPVAFRGGRGTAHMEAPRGSLFHDYEIDDRGIVRAANLVVATQQNDDAINRSIEQAARTHVVGKGDRALLNAVEFAIRCYDPCLSCATHAVGRMPLKVVVRQNGEVVRRFGRNADGEY
jgi:coenzyme F420-reducing hydrogenase alpha subunit